MGNNAAKRSRVRSKERRSKSGPVTVTKTSTGEVTDVIPNKVVMNDKDKDVLYGKDTDRKEAERLNKLEIENLLKKAKVHKLNKAQKSINSKKAKRLAKGQKSKERQDRKDRESELFKDTEQEARLIQPSKYDDSVTKEGWDFDNLINEVDSVTKPLPWDSEDML